MLIPAMAFPSEWLEDVPLIDSWTLPAIVLGVGFGLGSIVTGIGMLRQWVWPWATGFERATRHHWSWAATLAIGVGQVVWISLELVYLTDKTFLQAIYGAVGLSLATLPLLPSVRRYLEFVP